MPRRGQSPFTGYPAKIGTVPLPRPVCFWYKAPRQTLIQTLILGRRRHARAPCRIACLYCRRQTGTAPRPAPRRNQTFPYKAYVTADDVYVRSGPGENYYPTDKLKAGAEVEVYRHDPGGWFAIRPPKDSFSWVSSRHLQLDGNNLATVTDERVAARVGSRMSDARDVIQVRLHKGEVVEVLEPRGNGPAARAGCTDGLVQDRAAGGRVPLGLRPLRRSRITTPTACGRPGRRNRRPDRPGHGPLAGRRAARASGASPEIPEAARSRSIWNSPRWSSKTRASGTWAN